MIAQIQGALSAHGLANNTYLVLSSDNGYHTGEYRLMPGKLTAFNTDIHVPLVIDGPRVPAPTTSDAMVENIDLAKTFAAIAGTTMSDDGHSLLPLLRGERPSGWRKAILVEHRGADTSADTPDFQEPASGNPDSYEALRTRDSLCVEYNDRKNSVSREFYNLRSDPFALHDTVGTHTGRQRAQLHSELSPIKRCHRGTTCWAAMRGAPPPLRTGRDTRDSERRDPRASHGTKPPRRSWPSGSPGGIRRSFAPNCPRGCRLRRREDRRVGCTHPRESTIRSCAIGD